MNRITIAPMSNATPITPILDQLGISYKLHVHERPPKSLPLLIAAQDRGLKPDQIIRSLLFRKEGDQYILVLMPAGSRVQWPKLRRYLGVSRVTTATAEEVQSITGYEPGTVSPFGLLTPIRILADRGLLDHSILSIGAGILDAGVILARDDLLRVLHPAFGDFAQTPSCNFPIDFSLKTLYCRKAHAQPDGSSLRMAHVTKS